MASINYAHKEIISKIVYYGPGLSGKTTNLQYVFQKIPSETRGELISLATDADRTLYFDFLPVNVGSIQGFATKFQLYTVPGQVYYNATRKLVLRGVDGVVFVADSQQEKMDENIESLQNLRDNLEEYGYNPDEIPMAIQYNKRDLPNILSIDELQGLLNPNGIPHFEAVASKGDGVFKTLKAISKLVLEQIRTNKMGGAPKKSKPTPQPEPINVDPTPVHNIQPIGLTPTSNDSVAVAEPKQKVAVAETVNASVTNVEPAVEEKSPAVEEIVKSETGQGPQPVSLDEAVAEPKQEVANAGSVNASVTNVEPAVEEKAPAVEEIVNHETDLGPQPVSLDEAVAEPEEKVENVPGIMKDNEAFANVVVSDTQGLPEAEEETPPKDDLEETTERSVLQEAVVSHENNENETVVEEDTAEDVENPNIEHPHVEPSEPQAIELEQDNSQPEDTVESKEPEATTYNEDDTQVSEFMLSNPLPLAKPQMAESRKVKDKRSRFSLFRLFGKKRK